VDLLVDIVNVRMCTLGLTFKCAGLSSGGTVCC